MKDAAEMTPVEALTLALKLAITAPTEEKSKACVAMANGIIDSNQLTGSDIQAATRMAQHQRDAEEGRKDLESFVYHGGQWRLFRKMRP